MALHAIHTLHHVATCDACGQVSSMICSKDIRVARFEAADRLRTDGWTHRLAAAERRPPDWVVQQFAGEWLCPECVARGGPSAGSKAAGTSFAAPRA